MQHAHPPLQQAAPAPVFLICSERSGSNLISTIMGTHSQVYAPPPHHFGRIVLLNLYKTLQEGRQSLAWSRLQNYAVGRVQALQDPADAQRVEQWLKAQSDINPKNIARFLYQGMMPEAEGKTVFIKENNLHNLMFFLLDCFPGARFVFQVRDPRDYLTSAKAAVKAVDGNKFGSTRKALRIWQEDQQGGLQALGLLGPDRVFLHRYEDLLLAPQETLQRLCNFLGFTFESDMLEYHNTEKAVALAASTKQRKNISQPLMSGNFAKYRTALPEKEILRVERRLGRMMHMFGYPLDLLLLDKSGKKRRRKTTSEQSSFKRSPLLPPLNYGPTPFF